MAVSIKHYSQLMPILVCGAVLFACAIPRAVKERPTAESARAAAKTERFISSSFTLEEIDLGVASVGPNTFRVQVTNNQATPLTLGLDIRAAAGLWFRAWQRQFAFDLAPGQAQVIQVTYEFFTVTPESTLRVRFGPAVRTSQGPPRLVRIDFERLYAVGAGNPAAALFEGSFREYKTEHLDLFAVTGSLAATRLQRIAAEREEAIRRISEILAVSAPQGIRLVFYPDAAAKTADTGHIGVGLARGSLLVEVYSAETQLDPYHELAHILGHQLGNPPALLNEGFATYVAERLGGSALEHLGHQGRSIDEVVRDLARSGQLVPLRELIQFTEIGSETSRPAVTYPEAASVVKFLIETYGLPRFRQVFATMVNSDDPGQAKRNSEQWSRVYGHSIEQIEVSWRQGIDSDARSNKRMEPSRPSSRIMTSLKRAAHS